jgi:hypothetical protein
MEGHSFILQKRKIRVPVISLEEPVRLGTETVKISQILFQY